MRCVLLFFLLYYLLYIYFYNSIEFRPTNFKNKRYFLIVHMSYKLGTYFRHI